jgi:transcriptional regulator with XRE-family HTH domain
MSQAPDVTRELAAFLRTRRERLTLADVALPERGRQRRTPGLRREEVAELAGVSTDYVVRLEQGRGLRPSPEVLDALAGALRLDRDERAYLFDLVGHRISGPETTEAGEPAAELAGLVAALSPLPAMLVDHRFDILIWNGEMAGLMCDFAKLPDEQRNTMWLCILDPRFREFYRDREKTVREGIADLRAAWAARPDDTALEALITALNRSEEFARLWAQRDVRVNGRGVKRLCHQTLGPLAVQYEALIPLQNPELRLIVYRAADPVTQRAFDVLAEDAEGFVRRDRLTLS